MLQYAFLWLFGLFWLFVIPPQLRHYVRRRQVIDRPGSQCIGCGYDMSGLRSDTACPECGTPATAPPPPPMPYRVLGVIHAPTRTHARLLEALVIIGAAAILVSALTATSAGQSYLRILLAAAPFIALGLIIATINFREMSGREVTMVILLPLLTILASVVFASFARFGDVSGMLFFALSPMGYSMLILWVIFPKHRTPS